jgi:two-component system, NtrC family, response regulator HydG
MAATPILLVDDDRDTCATMADIIDDLGYQVEVAHDGPAALELASQKAFGLALLDYKMPGMNGVEVYRRLRRLRTETAGILVTAFAGKKTIDDASEAGLRSVFPKPVDFDRLLPLIEEVVGKPGPRCG